MKKKPKIWAIVLGVLVAAGLIGAIADRAKEPESRTAPVTVVTAAPLPTSEPTPLTTSEPTPLPTSEPTPKPTPTPAPLQTLAQAPAEAAAAPDRSAPAADPTPTPAPERDYVINTNTGKFHVPSCSSVKDIASYNRSDVHMTRDAVIAQGWQPCGKCKP